MNLISIVTITLDNYEELILTLNSIKNLAGVESIVINGGACKKTKLFLENYKGKSISEKDEGISDAFNKGIDLSKEEYIMFLNSGDLLVDPAYLIKASILFDKEDYDFIYSDILFGDFLGNCQIIKPEKNKPLSKGMPYPHQSLILKRSIFDHIGKFDKKLKITMDFDIILRMKAAGFIKGKYIPMASVFMDSGGISSNNKLACINEIKKVLIWNNRYSRKAQFRLFISKILYYVRLFFSWSI